MSRSRGNRGGNRTRQARYGSNGKPEAQPGYNPPRITTKQETEPEDRIPLFYIDDVEYSIQRDLPPALGLRYLRTLRDGGSVDQAIAELMTDAMGEDAFDALCECNQVGREEMAKIVDMVLDLALAGTGSGKSSSGAPN